MTTVYFIRHTEPKSKFTKERAFLFFQNNNEAIREKEYRMKWENSGLFYAKTFWSC